MAVLYGMATYSLFWMCTKGHHKILAPMTLAFAWIMLSYAGSVLGLIDDSTRIVMLRDSLIVIGVTAVVGSILYWDWLRHDAYSSGRTSKKH